VETKTNKNTIVIERRTLSQNTRDRLHHMEKHKERNQWILLLRFCISPMPPPPQEHQNIIITSFREKLILDHANLVGGMKGLIDAMVAAGLMFDDSDRWITVEYKQEKCKRIDERTEIYLDLFDPIRPLRAYRSAKR